MKLNKLISTVLAFAITFGTVACALPVFSFASSAAEAEDEREVTLSGADIAALSLNQVFTSSQDKIDNDPFMKLYAENDHFELHANRYTGEVYVKDKASGQVMTTNPYYIGDDHISDTIPKDLLSQLSINFYGTDGATVIYNSYEWAASRGQVKLSLVENGIRLSYTIGDTTTRYLAPNGISKKNFEDLIMIPMQEKIAEMVLEMLNERLGEYDEAKQKYENQDVLTGYIESAAGFAEKDFDSFIAAFDYFARLAERTERGEAPKDIIVDFVEWWEETYKRYKVLCNNDYRLYSEFGTETRDYNTLYAMYALKDPGSYNNPILRDQVIKQYPATVKNYTDENPEYYPLYALDNTLTNAQKKKIQNIIARFAPDYTLDQMYADEQDTQLEPELEVNPVFRMSLIYTITDEGMTVRLPSNSIFYDETRYTIREITVLPYLGMGNLDDGGYIFYPDGSGAIVDYSDFSDKNVSLSGEIYGHDHTFYAVTGANQENIYMPVYGAVSNQFTYTAIDFQTGKTLHVSEETYNKGIFEYTLMTDYVGVDTGAKDEEGNPVYVYYYDYYYLTDSEQKVYLPHSNETVDLLDKSGNLVKVLKKQSYKNAKGQSITLNPLEAEHPTLPAVTSGFEKHAFTDGFFAVIEDGSAMSSMSMVINGASQDYASIGPVFVPLPHDTYEMSAKDVFTVIAEQKYMDDLSISFFLLTDESIAAEKNINTTHTSSYVGMANVYRDYLADLYDWQRLEGLGDELPLYLETFGVMETLKKILTFPVYVDVALTSFEDVQTMYKELEAAGIGNVKFKLTGYANGGMYSRYPAKLKWEREAGGKSGFRKLLEFATDYAAQGLQLFPNFDFQYVTYTGTFDGIRIRKVSARTVDNRYAQKMTYSPYLQEYNSNVEGLIVAPNVISEIYEAFNRKYQRYNNNAIALADIGKDLSSSYDEDAYLLREDAMKVNADFLAQVAKNYQIMTHGGNVYALANVKFLLDAPVDSSHFRATSSTVPFFGMVMHGYLQYAGEAINESGNPGYELLRAIESGASLYFILSYANTNLMKDDMMLNEYYSVNYQIWNKGYIYDDAGEYLHRIGKDAAGKDIWVSIYYDDAADAYYYEANGTKVYELDGKAIEPTKYVEGGDVYKYYTTLNEALGGLQEFLISDHRFITGERVITAREELADRLSMEEDFLSILENYVKDEEAARIKDLEALNDFYEASVEDLAVAYATARYNSDSDAWADAYVKAKADMRTDYELYKAYLVEYKGVDEFKNATKNITLNLSNAYILTLIGITEEDKAIQRTGESYDCFEKVVAAVANGTVSVLAGQKIGVSVDGAALLMQALDEFGITEEQANTLEDVTAFKNELSALVAKLNEKEADAGIVSGAEIVIEVTEIDFARAPENTYVTDSDATDADYASTIYTIDNNTIVMVTYTKGSETKTFVLNYNTFDVTVKLNGQEQTIKALGFAVVYDTTN